MDKLEQGWLEDFASRVTAAFPGRVACLGLQGSRGRGEARPDSDIDMVVILDALDYGDLGRLRQAVEGLPGREKLCGFVSGKRELLAWEPAELFQFYHDTLPLLGDLEFLRPRFGPEDAARAVRDGLCALYHGCVHNALHQRDEGVLAGLYKGAVFTLQALHFCRTGEYIRGHGALAGRLAGLDQEVARRALALRAGAALELDRDGALLLDWCAGLLRSL